MEKGLNMQAQLSSYAKSLNLPTGDKNCIRPLVITSEI